ncbi:MAG: hypothetical protein IPL67_06665 [Ignavibacteria bacterium]|nr:hypothetical protein [Ignavibacteria bacterium]
MNNRKRSRTVSQKYSNSICDHCIGNIIIKSFYQHSKT